MTWQLGPRAAWEAAKALDVGRLAADALVPAGRIEGAMLALPGQVAMCCPVSDAA